MKSDKGNGLSLLGEVMDRLKDKEPELDLVVKRLAARKREKERKMETYNITALSKKLGISIRTLRGYVRDKKIKAKLIGRTYFISEAEVDRFLSPPEEDATKAGPDFLTVSQYHKKAGLPETTIREWLRRGMLQGVKDKGRWLIDPGMVKWWREIQAGMKPKK